MLALHLLSQFEDAAASEKNKREFRVFVEKEIPAMKCQIYGGECLTSACTLLDWSRKGLLGEDDAEKVLEDAKTMFSALTFESTDKERFNASHVRILIELAKAEIEFEKYDSADSHLSSAFEYLKSFRPSSSNEIWFSEQSTKVLRLREDIAYFDGRIRDAIGLAEQAADQCRQSDLRRHLGLVLVSLWDCCESEDTREYSSRAQMLFEELKDLLTKYTLSDSYDSGYVELNLAVADLDHEYMDFDTATVRLRAAAGHVLRFVGIQ